jgi:aspartyl-tRNA synthetase
MGTVKARDESLVNTKIPTGEIEVFVRDLEVLGASEELPLIVFGDQEYPEETRLKYRYLDLRREIMQKNMTLRSDVVGVYSKKDVGPELQGVSDTYYNSFKSRRCTRLFSAVQASSR